MAKWFIRTIDISGGFLPGVSLTLPYGLTCIIGPRGSGKTTLAEALRFALGGMGAVSKAGGALLGANLASSVIRVHTHTADGQSGYTISRTGKQQAKLLAADGTPVTEVDLDRRTFLPLDGYSSKEMEDIADEVEGERRRTLLDELRADDIRAVTFKLADQRRGLDANADAIRQARTLIADLTEQIEELGDARARLATLPELQDDELSDELLKATEQLKANRAESLYLTELQGILRELTVGITQCQSNALARIGALRRPDQSANADILAGIVRIASTAMSSVGDLIADINHVAEESTTSIQTHGLQLHAAHETQNAHFVSLQERNASASEAVKQRTEAEAAVAKLIEIEGRLQAAKQELESLETRRSKLRGDYLIEQEQISALREDVARTLQGEVGESVHVQVRRNADFLRYQQLLSEGLKGAGVRNHDDIVENLLRLRPEQLAQIIQQTDVDELDHQLSLGQERSRKIINAFQGNIDPMALELVEIDDRIRIELNVSPTGEPNYKDAAELSRGQKCTALLPLLIARRETPLVIDQPEDNLDNRFIFETVVETIRRVKQHRQMIFITHNANIPVLAEAEMVVVLNSDGKSGFVQKCGSLDECRDEIVELLEGGKEAFELRRQRYAR